MYLEIKTIDRLGVPAVRLQAGHQAGLHSEGHPRPGTQPSQHAGGDLRGHRPGGLPQHEAFQRKIVQGNIISY